MKTLFQYTAFYNGRTAKLQAAGDKDAHALAIEHFKMSRKHYGDVTVKKGEPVKQLETTH